MRFIIFITLLICILASAGYVGYLAPYHVYTLALKEGLKTDFIETKVLPREMLLGGNYKLFDNYNFTFGLDNIFDEKYEQAHEYSTLGRTLNFGLKKVY